MDEIVAWVRLERDRRAIEELHKRYFWLINMGEVEKVNEEVFSPDATITLGAKYDPEEKRVQGGTQIRGPGSPPTGFQAGLSAISVPSKPVASTHGMMQCMIELDGDTARSETYATSFLVIDGDPKRILIRGIRYLDKLVRIESGWRISHRLPGHDWMFEADAAFALNFSERLQLRHLG